MKNSIDAHIEFSFKGEIYSLNSTFDLDKLLLKFRSPPSLHELLAKEHGIDTYSYLFEVMLVDEIQLSNATGFVADFLQGVALNQPALESNWEDLRMHLLLQPIALEELGIADLGQNESVRNALIQAYNLGRSDRSE